MTTQTAHFHEGSQVGCDCPFSMFDVVPESVAHLLDLADAGRIEPEIVASMADESPEDVLDLAADIAAEEHNLTARKAAGMMTLLRW